jgi:RNA polymerase sigma-70 factor, ECF subfamily
MSDTAVRQRDLELTQLQQRLFQLAYMILADRAASEDVAQESVARVMQHRESWRGEGDFFAWACAIAVNLCRGKRKADRKRATLLDQRRLERADVASPTHGPATSVVLHESHQRAAVAVRALSPLLREVFILHYIEGLPYASVSEILGISSGAARLRAKRARESLRESLSSMLAPDVHRAVQAEAAQPPRTRRA